MSLLSMGTIAIGRDLAKPGERLAKGRTLSAQMGSGSAAAAPTSASAVGGGEVATFAQVLVAQIPSEALVAYTTVLAVFVSAGSSYNAGRWVVYGSAIAVCAALVLSTYLAQRTYQFNDHQTTSKGGVLRAKHLPWLPMASAMWAMAVFGLTVPGSPLEVGMSATAFAVTSVSLAVGGAVVMTILTPILGKGNGAKSPG